jgi:chemotaxis protein MotB
MSRRSHVSRVSHERWLVSYADFITLLFAFFVVLYAFANGDRNKQAQVSDSIDTAFSSLGIFSDVSRRPTPRAAGQGHEPAAMPVNIVMGEELLAPAQVKQDLDKVRRDLTQTLSNQVAAHTVSIHMGQEGLVISLREAGFFAIGSAEPRPQSLETLRVIGARLGHTPYDVRIEGHTDNIPIHNAQFASNWELSTARASRIARFFLETNAIPPQRLSAAGYAEYHPVAPNNTPEGRAENRRVDLVVLPRTRLNFAATAPASQPDAHGSGLASRP